MSWAEKIFIDQESYLKRFPDQKKQIIYRRCAVDKFSEHLEGNEQLVLRISLFDNDEWKGPAYEVREVFAPRL